MSFALRFCLVLASLATFIFVLRKIKKSQIQLDDSLFWIMLAGFIFLASMFPQVFSFAANILQVESTANFVFLVFIFILFVKCFSLSVKLSQETAKTRELIQQLAIERYERRNNDYNFEQNAH